VIELPTSVRAWPAARPVRRFRAPDPGARPRE